MYKPSDKVQKMLDAVKKQEFKKEMRSKFSILAGLEPVNSVSKVIKSKNQPKWKINTNKKVIDQNRDLIFPQLGAHNFMNRSITFTPESKRKLDMLRAKYKISRSAIIRILLDNV